jgi:cytochrome c biogenesis protein CcmG, thiol:disulfide interchange protein DsbE
MNWRSALVGLAAGVPVVVLLAWGLTRDATAIPSPLPGRPAPDFTMSTLTGNDTVRLGDLRGNVVVLNFWASWCASCVIEHRDLSEAARTYADQGVYFYGLLFRDTPANGERWIERMGGQSYPALIDDGSLTAISYGITAAPETFVVGPDGIVAHKFIGPVTAQQLAGVIEPLLTQR